MTDWGLVMRADGECRQGHSSKEGEGRQSVTSSQHSVRHEGEHGKLE